MPATTDSRIYSATYSNTPVYEFNAAGNHVMRRKSDDWINATHILKVAGLDKPARTRVLEREVQKGVHEKVQGGYGKYQGTWVPLLDGRDLAQRNGVLEKMLPIFDFVPGDRSPPPAPKHVSAPAAKSRAPRTTAAQRRRKGECSRRSGHIRLAKVEPAKQKGSATDNAEVEDEMSQNHFDDASIIQNVESPDNDSIVSESIVEDMMPLSGGSRKRKRDAISLQDQEHRLWADALLDYFMLLESAEGFPTPPPPPAGIDLDRPIDEKGHCAMHWAVAMGEPAVVKDLIRRGASIDCRSGSNETPLMRAVMYTNNLDKNTMVQMVRILLPTVTLRDFFGSTIFHHIAATTSSRNKFLSARHYLDTVVNILSETWTAEDITRLLNMQDNHGDTAILIAARNGARKCVRSLLGRDVAVDIPNDKGETAEELIQKLNHRRQTRGALHASSSPFAPDVRMNGNGITDYKPVTAPRYRSQTANTLVTSIAPAVGEQLGQLAAAYEAELDDKEQENNETERVLRKRQAEVAAIQRQIVELEALDQRDVDVDDEIQDAELDSLIREAEALLELEQRHELNQLIAREISKGVHAANGVDGEGHDVMQEKLRLATALYRAQAERKALVLEIVQNMSVAGLGERQVGYKRLITAALGVRDEDVEGMLGDILAELEENRERERLEASPE